MTERLRWKRVTSGHDGTGTRYVPADREPYVVLDRIERGGGNPGGWFVLVYSGPDSNSADGRGYTRHYDREGGEIAYRLDQAKDWAQDVIDEAERNGWPTVAPAWEKPAGREVPVTDLYVQCSYPVRVPAVAMSDCCRQPARTAVETPSGARMYRCAEHEGEVNSSMRGPVHLTVTVSEREAEQRVPLTEPSGWEDDPADERPDAAPPIITIGPVHEGVQAIAIGSRPFPFRLPITDDLSAADVAAFREAADDSREPWAALDLDERARRDGRKPAARLDVAVTPADQVPDLVDRSARTRVEALLREARRLRADLDAGGPEIKVPAERYERDDLDRALTSAIGSLRAAAHVLGSPAAE